MMRAPKGFGRAYHHILMNEIEKKNALHKKYDIDNILNNGALRSQFPVRYEMYIINSTSKITRS
jgi:hypothetical protein